MSSDLHIFVASALLAYAANAAATVTPLPGTTPQTVVARDHFAPLRVRVTDAAGAPVPGARVSWYMSADPANPVTFDSRADCTYAAGWSCRVTAGADGVAALSSAYGSSVGTQTLLVRALSPAGDDLGSTNLVLSVTPAAPPAALRILGGTQQVAARGSALPQPFAVELVNANGTPREGAMVTFTSNGDGALGDFANRPAGTNVTVVTDSQGIAVAPAFTIKRGLGPGRVTAITRDTAAQAVLEATFTFISTAPDGGVFVDLQDTWWAGPAERGWGLSIAQEGDLLFTVLFVYDSAGRPTWEALDQGRWVSNMYFERLAAQRYSPTGSPYFAYDVARFNPGSPALAGALLDTPSDQRVDLSILPGLQRKALRPFDFEGSGATAPITGLGGMWWVGPSEAGWAIAISERQGDLFGLWFTYDEDGSRTWFSLTSGAWQPDGKTFSGTIYRTSGPTWPNYDASRLVIEPVGAYAIAFGMNTADFNWTIGTRSGRSRLERYVP